MFHPFERALTPQIDLQPEIESKFSAYLFFVLFIIVGAFFILNLFVGVVIDSFKKIKMKVNQLTIHHKNLLISLYFFLNVQILYFSRRFAPCKVIKEVFRLRIYSLDFGFQILADFDFQISSIDSGFLRYLWIPDSIVELRF